MITREHYYERFPRNSIPANRTEVYNLVGHKEKKIKLTSCARGDTICPAPLLLVGAQEPCAPPSRRNVAVLSHAEYVPTLTAEAALRVKATLSKAA